MVTQRLDIEYDGGGFTGWAAQPGLRTVQGELEGALATVLREKVELTVAGRTDAGVHAWGQVASFASDPAPEDLVRRLNGLTGTDLTVLAAAEAAAGFDARRDARSRTYCYRVHARRASSPFERGRALWWRHRIEPDRLAACAESLPGTHDFTAFTPTETTHTRFERNVTRAEWAWSPAAGPAAEAGAEHAGGIWSFWVEADSFMHNMVRILAGTMLEVASGRRGVDDFRRLLEGAPRSAAGETAPAHGLYLASVSYGSG
jgi:tRNA pseudouridine38-40 synthase